MKRIIILLSIILFSSCELEDPENGILISDIIELKSESFEIPADGNSRVKITAILKEKSNPNQAITFSTDQGSFAGTNNAKDITLTSSGKTAEAYLVSDLEVNDYVTVYGKVGDFSTSLVLSFSRSLPTSISMIADKLLLKANRSDRIQLSIELFKDGEGEVSEETRVNFTQKNIEGNSTIQLPEFSYSNQGKLTIDLISKSAEVGEIQISASVDGTELTSTIEIEVVSE